MQKKRYLPPMMNSVLGLLAAVGLGLSGVQRFGQRPMVNFVEAAGPRYLGRYASPAAAFDGTLNVVSWNIQFARRVPEALAFLREALAAEDVDVLLLQEMDHDGVDQLARALGYDYLYYPASIHSRHGRQFGNAILSRWPIEASSKLLLPLASPLNDQRRIAVRAQIAAGDTPIDVYSVHAETPVLGASGQQAQIDFLAAALKEAGGAPVIVGGDFNTLLPGSNGRLRQAMDAAGLGPAAARLEATIGPRGLGLTLDHLFVRGLEAVEAGVWSGARASDHFPVWARLTL
jgi:endonuclease/exonuclease/phosphatase family metal-dependent hydrolase